MTDKQRYLVQQSHLAYFTIENEIAPIIERELAAGDGDVVLESNEDHLDNYWESKRLLRSNEKLSVLKLN